MGSSSGRQARRKSGWERRYWVTALGIVAVIALLGALLGRQPSPGGGWTRVNGVSVDPSVGLRYHWLTDHELLYFQEGRQESEWTRLDVRTGREMPLGRLTRMFTAHGGWDAELSPDGSKFLWQDARPFGVAYRSYVAPLDGSYVVSHIGKGYVLVRWLNAGSSWGEFRAAPYTRMGYGVTICTLSGRSRAGITVHRDQRVRIHNVVLSADYVAVRSADLFYGGPRGVWQVSNRPLAGQPDEAPISYGTLPRSWGVVEAVVEPRSGAIALLLEKHSSPTLVEAFMQWIGRRQVSPMDRAAVWVGRPQERELHRVAELPWRYPAPGASQRSVILPCELKWVPGGQKVSLIFQNALYTIAVK